MMFIGVITEISNEITFKTEDGRDVRKKIFVIKQNKPNVSKPDMCAMAIFNDMIDNSGIEIGKEYKVLFDSSVYKSPNNDGTYRYFNDLRAWQITPSSK